LILRQAIWRKPLPQWTISGIPETFYTDHGSDFTSEHLEQVSADLEMALAFSEPGMPRGRGKIERFFRTLNQMLLCHLPGYTPASMPPDHALLTVSAFEAELQRFILDQYHQRPHHETGEPPQARWESGGFLPRLPESLEQLDLLFLTVAKSRKVRPDGIHFQGLPDALAPSSASRARGTQLAGGAQGRSGGGAGEEKCFGLLIHGSPWDVLQRLSS